MRRHRSTTFVALLAVGLLVSPASAITLESKNKKGSECSARWDVAGDAFKAMKGKAGNWKLDCEDGAACDTDGELNDSCTVSLAACAAVAVDGCTPTPVSEFKFAPKKNIDTLRSGGFADPPTGATEETCGNAGTAVLPLKVKKSGKKKPSKPIKAVMKFRDEGGKGKSKVTVRCVEGSGGTTTTTMPGGNGFCAEVEPGMPKQIAYTVPPSGSDLDNGWQGDSHNFPVVNGSTLTYCLSNCDATTDPECDGYGPTGEDTVNGPTFGAPLPLLAAQVPVCVINRFQGDFMGTINLQTGEASSDVMLFADTYVTGNANDICPRCNAAGNEIGATGTCSSSARNAGAACTVEGLVEVPGSSGASLFKLSSACIPPGNQLAGTLDITLPLTTGTSTKTGSIPCTDPGRGLPPKDDNCGAGQCNGACSGPATCDHTDDMGRCIDAKGGISQLCCSNNPNRPCFPSAPDSGGEISRTGTPKIPLPAWPDPTYPKSVDGNVFGAVFCEDATGSTQVNLVTGLPGPGALLLPGDALVTTSTE